MCLYEGALCIYTCTQVCEGTDMCGCMSKHDCIYGRKQLKSDREMMEWAINVTRRENGIHELI